MSRPARAIRLAAVVLLSGCGEDAPTEVATGLLPPSEPTDIVQAIRDIPTREGDLPERTFGIPHLQLTQGGPPGLGDRLIEAIDRLDSVHIGAVPLMREGGSLYEGRSWELRLGASGGPDREKFEGGSFGHLHHPSNNSMHLFLPRQLFREVVGDRGWGERHAFSAMNGLGTPTADYVMIWGLRTEEELETVWLIVQASYAYVRGLLPADGP